MSTLFYRVFNIVKSNKIVAIILLILLLAGAAYTSLNIRLEENIVNIMPKDEKVSEVNKVFEGIKINNRLVFHLYSDDSTEAIPDSLVKVATALADSLQKDYPEYYKEIILTVPDEQMQQMYDYYYDNLPFYLTSDDYKNLDERLQKGSVDNSVNRVYKQLLSPMGVATKMLLKDPLGLAGMPLQRMRENQLDSNFDLYQNFIVTKNLKHLVFFVVLSNPPNETSNNGIFVEGINVLQQQFEKNYPEVTVDYFGPAAVAVANASRIKNDVYLTVTVAMVALFLFISLFYRNIGTFFIVVTPGVFGGLMAIAFLSIVRPSVSIISLAVGSVLLGITIDYALHFFTHYKKEKDLQKLFADITVPMVMSSLTTSFAFFSLIFIRSSALQDLGIFAGVSVLASVFYTLVVMPHLVTLFSTKEKSAPKKMNIVERVVSAIATYPFYKKKWAIILFVLLSAISLFTWKKVSFESNMLSLNYMPQNLERSQNGINAISNFTANNIYVAFHGDDLDDVLSKNEKLNVLLEKLEKDSVIYAFYSLNQVVPSPEVRQERLAEWKQFWSNHSPDSLMINVNESAVALGFKEGTFSDLDKMLNSEHKDISSEDIQTVLSAFGDELIINEKGNAVSVLTSIALDVNDKPQVLSQLEEIPGIIILDKSYITNKLVDLLQQDFGKLVNISLGLVFLLILFSYGRIELALITFIPIMLSWLWVLGLMGWLGLTFNIVNIIICTFIFGLGVDYSIFVMRGLTQKYASGEDNLISYKKSIILSVVTTLLGIGVLAIAEHPALKSIAFLAIIGIMSVVLITFTVEHLLYNLFIQKRKDRGLIPFTFSSFIFTAFAFTCFLLGCLILFLGNVVFRIPFAPQEWRKRTFHKVIMAFSYFVIYVMANVKKEVRNRENIDFSKPSVLIANHHSFIDILLLLMFSPKVVMVTNDWVYNSPLFGKSVQYADFIPATQGMEGQLDKIKELVKKGYSIAIFPEGTRSSTADLGRFHKGAFFLAEELGLDIQPVLLHGTSMTMQRSDYYLKNSRITVKFLPRIKQDDLAFGEGYRERSKAITKYFKSEYQKLRDEIETVDFYKETIHKNYVFKGPILEWYIKIKYGLEGAYSLFDELVPKSGQIVDVGCGYGLMTYSLGFTHKGRKFLGVDYDEQKIIVANNCPVKPDNINFEPGDVLTYDFKSADVFIISDVLHYLTPSEQEVLLNRVYSQLNDGGKIIIRDGDINKTDRHKGTVLTEIFSTGIGFNKTRNALSYISSDMITSFADEHNLELEVIDKSKRTSNTVFVLTQK